MSVLPNKIEITGRKGGSSLSHDHWRAPGGPRSGVMRRSVGLSGLAAALTVLIGTQAQAGEVYTRWPMPRIAVPEAERPAAPDVFGTVALPVRARQTGTRWTKLMGASLDQPALIRLVEPVRGQDSVHQAAYVQVVVDRAMRSRASAQDCSDDGYWAAGGETLSRGLGDCFDVAIAKMEALRVLGFSHRDLYLTTGYYNSATRHGRGRATAALLVRLDSGFLLLPEGSDPVIAASHEGDLFGSFKPYITYGYGATWVHGRIVKPAPSDGSGKGALALSR
jgi:predicted transglutaminase-like cysteine proteinase